ncbi:hypothetical protein [Actinomadura macra]|uniref:hypothetical protein n=1 Tax=Actinomadura macra TaxID=46164 RepID=UPI0008317073|nr:hypothetical protein [Actinomadura macra]
MIAHFAPEPAAHPVRPEPHPAAVPVPVAVVRTVLEHLRAHPDTGDTPDPDTVQILTPHGLVGIRTYHPGLSESYEAWGGDLDWAVLVLCPSHGEPEIYLFPARDFVAGDQAAVLQHVDYVSPNEPGVFWTDLDQDARAGRYNRLAGYRLT